MRDNTNTRAKLNNIKLKRLKTRKKIRMYKFEILMNLKIQVIDVKHIEQLRIPDKVITAAKFKLIITVVITNLQ